MELKSNERRWVDVKSVQDVLSVGKTKAHQIVHQNEDEDPNAVIQFVR